MGRKLTFFPTCGSGPSKTLSFRTTAGDITGDLDNMQVVSTGEMDSSVESVIRGLSSDRFFFKPGKTSSILDEAKVMNKNEKESIESVLLPLKESVSMMDMESTDPFVDFKKSMQEMVEADEGLKEWDNLQELLSVYLAVNDKINHGYIIGAFVDLFSVNHSPSSSSSSSSSSSCMNGQELSLLMKSSSIISSCNNNTKKIGSKSPESALSFTSFTSSASSSGSGICSSSTSHCLSSCSLEEEEEDDDELDHNSPEKAVVSDNAAFSKV